MTGGGRPRHGRLARRGERPRGARSARRIQAMNNLREAITDGVAKLTSMDPAQLGASLGGLLGGQLAPCWAAQSGLSAEAAAQALNMAAAGLTAATGQRRRWPRRSVRSRTRPARSAYPESVITAPGASEAGPDLCRHFCAPGGAVSHPTRRAHLIWPPVLALRRPRAKV